MATFQRLGRNGGPHQICDECLEWARQWPWRGCPSNGGMYAAIGKRENGKYRQEFLCVKHAERHGLELNGAWPDHIDRDATNDRFDNYRPANRSQQQANSPKKGKKTGTTYSSQYKGVCWRVRERTWEATITISGRKHHLGQFESEADAAIAYDEASREAFGAYARFNFPRDGERSALT